MLSGYERSFESSREARLDDEVIKIQNGGLFTRDRCAKLAKYEYMIKQKNI